MHDYHKHLKGSEVNLTKSAEAEDLRDDSVKALEDGLKDLYLDLETVWLLARDLFRVTDDYLLKRAEANLPILKLTNEGLVLKCDKCRRPSSFGPSGIRKNCYYCGELLPLPKPDEIKDITPLFIPPQMGMADIDILGVSISASYTYASPLQPGKAQKAQNSSENTRLNTKAQQLYFACQQLDERYRLTYLILLSVFDLLSEQLAITPSDFVGVMLSKPIDVSRADTCFFYPYSLLSVVWHYVSVNGDISVSQYEETKKTLIANRENHKRNEEARKVTCPKCGRETSPTGYLHLKCLYCASRLREITYSDVFPDQI